MSNRPDFRLERPFAELGDKTIIPNRSTISGRADLENGFPLITQQPIAQGGVPPSRTDFNGILYQLSQFCMYYQSGGMWEWQEDTDYDNPAIVYYNGVFYKCLKANGPKTENVTPPGTDSETWTDINPDLSQNWQEIYDAIARASELYESTQLPVIGTDMDGAFSVAGDTRDTIKAGDVVKIGLFRYTVLSASYSEGGKYTTYTVDNPVLASLQGKIVTKKVDYITHITPVNYDMAEVPDGGFSSANPPNATDNFRVISPAYAVALINYMMREAGSMIGGVDYTGTGFTVASVTGDGKSKITIDATLSAVLEKIHVGNFLQIVQGDNKVIACVYDIELVNGTPQLMLDKTIADTYVGGTINKGTRAEDEGIIVTPGQKVQLIKVTVTPDTITQDETAQATALIYPPDAENQTISWSVLETDIATINSSSGLITPVEGGDVGGVTVIGAATDGSGVSGFSSIDVVSSGLGSTAVIGVVDTGVRNENGAVLEWIDEDFNIISELPENFFDTHVTWNFQPELLYEHGNFIKIPRAYTRRGVVPNGKPYAGNFFMMISPTLIEGFSPNIAFKRNGEVKDSFYISAYRAYNMGNNLPGSESGKNVWTSLSPQLATQYTEALDGDYHVTSYQEWCEICTRAIIEKKTFKIIPQSDQSSRDKCVYRGINDFCYNDKNTGTYEMLTGIRALNSFVELWDENGFQTYYPTLVAASLNLNLRVKSFLSAERYGQGFNNIFLSDPSKTTTSVLEAIMPDRMSIYNGSKNLLAAHLFLCERYDYAGALSLFIEINYTNALTNSVFRISKA